MDTPQDSDLSAEATDVVNQLNARWEELVHRIVDENDEAAQKELDELKEHLIAVTVQKFKDKDPEFGMPELTKLAREGLEKAEQKFQPASGFPYGTQATWWIRQAIITAIADKRSPREDRTYNIK